MPRKNWQQVKDTFHDALRIDSGERNKFLNEACEGDIEFRIEVESLLISLAEAKNFLEQPVTGEISQSNAWRLANGQLISHYKIISPIASGGMGEVYLAEDVKLRRRVALKILPEDMFADKSRLLRFEREADVVSALNHPNILTIFEFGSENNIHLLASEFVKGETLRSRIGSSNLRLPETLDIAIQIASALHAAHQAGVVHRDIKPENVMIRDDGYVKVLDFGLAKLTERIDAESDAETRRILSRPGVIMGTVTYMSPEQTRAKTIDARSDLFSLGVVLYEMLAGRVPFKGETTTDVIAEIIQKNPPPVRRFMDDDAPAELDRIIGKTLEKNREERYQTAADLLIDLKHLQKKLEITANIEAAATNVETINNHATEASIDRPTTSGAAFTGTARKPWYALAALVALMIAAVLALGYWYYNGLNPKQIDSIAVMPFVNESGNSDVEYLSDGMTESLINSLSKLPNLSVQARSSVFLYKGQNVEPKKVAADLNVQALLNGRVVQRGDDLTLYLSLVDAQTGKAVWGEQYIRKLKDLVNLQTEITRDVSQKLRTRLSNADQKILTKNYTENTEAYQLYLKGRYFWNKRSPEDFQKSRDYFQRAIDLDPTYALAYSGLADFYGISTSSGQLPPNETWPIQEALVRKALELDPNLAEVHNSLAGLKRYYYNDWKGSEQALKRAIELNPNYAEAHTHYGGLLTFEGRFDEALIERRRGLELDPLAPSINMRLGDTLYHMRRFDEAIEQYRKSVELDPSSSMIHNRLGDAYEQKLMHEQAIAEWSSALKLSKNGELAALLEQTYKQAGFESALRSVARKKLDLLNEKMQRGEYVPARDVARLYMRLGNREEAFIWLEKAAGERNAFAFEIRRDPIFAALRDDPRFQEVARRAESPL